ncbi:anti-sigma factor domain-containing protein [Halobacillus shinanisalinarum]|uniref:Anti-sigma factor domain-containing protein n=1 Tax=Halobacillus shinanisalinarum TaxID=2932258 RepID=A0ABY4GXM2_9BACI|nr:anti-sigma factor domain-containing protein [Halobacillus shinanisalinarum]UOQ92673.1 anti-sigma factor domain-containing protein [Halobacillus shinanisalinarum]
MRKGIVMEQSRKYTIVMTNDGAFHKAKLLKRAEVGMEVHFQPLLGKHTANKQSFMWRRAKVGAIVAALLIAFLPAYLWYGSNTAYAFVNIDMNPSVELELNEDMQVIDVIPLNKDAEKIISKLEKWYKDPASEVTFDMITLSQEMGFINNQNQVLIGVSYVNEHDEDFSTKIESFLANQSSNLTVASYIVPSQIREQAKKEKVSVNELMADSIKEETNSHSTKVTIEDEDKAIIQSFYKDPASSSEQPKSKANERLPEQPYTDPSNETFIIPKEKFEINKPSHVEEKQAGNSPARKENRSQRADEKAQKKEKPDHPSQKENPGNGNENKEKPKEHEKKDKQKQPAHKPKQEHKKNQNDKAKHEHKKNKQNDHSNNGHSPNKHENNGKANKDKNKPPH